MFASIQDWQKCIELVAIALWSMFMTHQAWTNFIILLASIILIGTTELSPGPCLNIKTVLSTYGDFHVKDKTAVRT